jgi:hypothetical protein
VAAHRARLHAPYALQMTGDRLWPTIIVAFWSTKRSGGASVLLIHLACGFRPIARWRELPLRSITSSLRTDQLAPDRDAGDALSRLARSGSEYRAFRCPAVLPPEVVMHLVGHD